ncbi:MAG: BREX-3 system P-loop-containing protein BrxF [Candidatus Thorarchaeota archaeon]
MKPTLSNLLTQADSLRFKLLAIVGKDESKKKKIIDALKKDKWTVIDVESELLGLRKELESSEPDIEIEIQPKIKEWFNKKPNNIILTNASILYHDLFLKISPVGAFKYNSRNKNCVLFLEDEQMLGSRVYYGQIGKEDYYDQEISDIIIAKIDDISDEYDLKQVKRVAKDITSEYAIGNLFDYHEIKDVVDIDADLKEVDLKRDIVSSFIISESLEQQIIEFFENLDKPKHKARTVIGNYGSGKSHLVGFLVSLVENPELSDLIKNGKIKKVVKNFSRKFIAVQFELQTGDVELKRWFYGKTKKQLKSKYNIDIPQFDPQKDYDDKENIIKIIEIIKEKDPKYGFLVVVDEISDFLSAKQKESMKSDLQFLRVIGQVCQDQDMMFIGSMQEDVFSSHKFKDVAGEIGRISERFQSIIIHQKDIRRVISERIVPKNQKQRHALEKKFEPFSEKIEDVSRNIDDYVELFPLTPFLIELFSDLPYFEKRGVIQFAMSEIKYLLNEDFPYFLTFEKIYDQLENNPNKRNLEEIFEISKAMHVLNQKISLLDNKYQKDATKIAKGLAVYSLWNRRERGATTKELSNNLMMLPQNKLLSAEDHIALIIKKVREATDGEYIKTHKDQSSGLEYFHFDTKAGIDPEEKIAQKAGPVSNDEIEHELFTQLIEILELERVPGELDLFFDECEWRSVKSYREGYIHFIKQGYKVHSLPPNDYTIIFVSPFVETFTDTLSKNQMVLKLDISGHENTELLKEIVAIKGLINSNFQKHIMVRKLEERINGYNRGNTQITGFKYRLSKLLIHRADCNFNGKPISIKNIIGREKANVIEILDELKIAVFDKPFNDTYPIHPSYSIQLSKRNIVDSLNKICNELYRQDFINIGITSKSFLNGLDLLDSQGYPDLSKSKIASKILDILKSKPKQVTDIEKDLVSPLKDSDFGLEPQIVHFHLLLITLLGKVYLQIKGGDRIDINNIKEKIKTLHAFETIAYVRLQEDYSYDFASRLFNALGLGQGAIKITIEKERLNAFREYQEKIYSILNDIKLVADLIDKLKERETIYINISAVEKEYNTIQEIDWNALNITNHMQFGSIEYLKDKIDKIVIALSTINQLKESLTEYLDFIQDSILYMENGYDVLDQHDFLVTDEQKLNSLLEFRKDIKSICEDFKKFTDRSQRNPIKGKIQQFKKIYMYDFYLPAHEKYVGKKVKWQILEEYVNDDIFRKVSILSNLTCINDNILKQKILSWTDLEQYRCFNPHLEENLQTSVRCQNCFFPGKVNYFSIPETLNNIGKEIESIYNTFERTIVKEVRSYRDNMKYLDNESEKNIIQGILDKQKLPDHITNETIRYINKLFKEIIIVEVDKDNVIATLFPGEEMITLEDLRKQFLVLENDLRKNRPESEIRIKLIKKD